MSGCLVNFIKPKGTTPNTQQSFFIASSATLIEYLSLNELNGSEKGYI